MCCSEIWISVPAGRLLIATIYLVRRLSILRQVASLKASVLKTIPFIVPNIFIECPSTWNIKTLGSNHAPNTF